MAYGFGRGAVSSEIISWPMSALRAPPASDLLRKARACQKNIPYFPTHEDDQRFRSRPGHEAFGSVFTPSDFLSVAARSAVDQALSRLVKGGQLRRLARGLYDFRKVHSKRGPLSPAPDDVPGRSPGRPARRFRSRVRAQLTRSASRHRFRPRTLT